ncbi:hypothetical protein ACSBR2_017333 [Camellia fascicularis]
MGSLPSTCPASLQDARGRSSTMCDIRETDIVGKAWGCQDCEFFIHKSCKDVPREIKHKSHRGETLTLRSSTYYESRKFYCNACRDLGEGFHYHCSPCKFDLHVVCAGTPYILSTMRSTKNRLHFAMIFSLRLLELSTVKCVTPRLARMIGHTITKIPILLHIFIAPSIMKRRIRFSRSRTAYNRFK